MPKGTTTANDVINAVLRAVDPGWRSGATRYVSLHTATPGAGGDQTTNEATFGSYGNSDYIILNEQRKLRIQKDEQDWLILLKIYTEQCL